MPKGMPNKRYTPEFKKIVIETMLEENLSYAETRQRFEITGRHQVQDWERIDLKDLPLNAEAAVAQVGRSSFRKR